ncbi:MAG: hypothetical protein IPF85_06270 [Anaerolineae bacterium]|nr:hypothetical protein [Anaerolineae bacterium]
MVLKTTLRLIAAAHRLGLKVMIDVVYNHTARFCAGAPASRLVSSGRQRQTNDDRAGLERCD